MKQGINGIGGPNNYLYMLHIRGRRAYSVNIRTIQGIYGPALRYIRTENTDWYTVDVHCPNILRRGVEKTGPFMSRNNLALVPFVFTRGRLRRSRPTW